MINQTAPSSEPRNQGNPVPPGLLLLLCLALSVSAFAARSFLLVSLVAGAELLLSLVLRLGSRFYLRILRFFALQSIIISSLYMLRFGLEEGLFPGLRISCQIALAFAPGMMALTSIPHSQLTKTLHRIMPAKSAFVLATSLRFIPLLQQELRSIYEVQLLRGARITPQDLRHLAGWKDVVHCLLVPFIVQIFKMTGEIALAAQIRNFDASRQRTFWPGD